MKPHLKHLSHTIGFSSGVPKDIFSKYPLYMFAITGCKANPVKLSSCWYISKSIWKKNICTQNIKISKESDSNLIRTTGRASLPTSAGNLVMMWSFLLGDCLYLLAICNSLRICGIWLIQIPHFLTYPCIFGFDFSHTSSRFSWCFLKRLWIILSFMRACLAISTTFRAFPEVTDVLIDKPEEIYFRSPYLCGNARWKSTLIFDRGFRSNLLIYWYDKKIIKSMIIYLNNYFTKNVKKRFNILGTKSNPDYRAYKIQEHYICVNLFISKKTKKQWYIKKWNHISVEFFFTIYKILP